VQNRSTLSRISTICDQGDFVTSQPPAAPAEGKTAGQFLRPLRDLAAYALVGVTAVLLFVALFRLIPSSAQGYSFRTQDAFYGFVNVETVFFPLGAVLLALMVRPRHPKAQLIVLAAVVEYAVAAFFGVIFGLIIGVIDHASNSGVRTAFEELLVRLAWLGLLALAAWAAFQIWRGMFYVPRPRPQPGVYGQPPQYNSAAYPGQPGFGPGQPPHSGPPYPGQHPMNQPGFPQHPGQPPMGQPPTGQPPTGQPPMGQPPMGQPHPGFPPPPPGQPGFPPHYPAPQSGPPAHGQGVYGQPPQPPSWNQPPVAMPAAAPDPTQVVPTQEAEPTAAESEPTDRPGFGPAEQDPPRH
jgi:hypothetical protein